MIKFEETSTPAIPQPGAVSGWSAWCCQQCGLVSAEQIVWDEHTPRHAEGHPPHQQPQAHVINLHQMHQLWICQQLPQVRQAIFDPGRFTKRGQTGTELEPLHSWQSRAVAEALGESIAYDEEVFVCPLHGKLAEYDLVEGQNKALANASDPDGWTGEFYCGVCINEGSQPFAVQHLHP